MVGLSQSDLARRLGVSRTSVSRWIKAGKLSTNPDGSLPQQALAVGRRLVAGETIAPRPVEATPARLAALTKDDLTEAQVRERRAKADRAEMETALRRGQLVEVAEVTAEAQRVAAAVREGLRAIPSRASLQIEAVIAGVVADAIQAAGLDLVVKIPRAPEIEALIGDEINTVVAKLQGRFLE